MFSVLLPCTMMKVILYILFRFDTDSTVDMHIFQVESWLQPSFTVLVLQSLWLHHTMPSYSYQEELSASVTRGSGSVHVGGGRYVKRIKLPKWQLFHILLNLLPGFIPGMKLLYWALLSCLTHYEHFSFLWGCVHRSSASVNGIMQCRLGCQNLFNGKKETFWVECSLNADPTQSFCRLKVVIFIKMLWNL